MEKLITEEQELIGKTIIGVSRKKHKEDVDDDAWLEVSFSDGTKALFVASYGGYTGCSIDEYPSYLILSQGYEYEDLK